MLPIAGHRFQVVVDGAARATDQLIGPPVMRNDIDVRAGRAQQFSRRMIHDDRVATANALHERIAKGWRTKKGRRQTNRMSGDIDNAGAAAIKSRSVLRCSLENG